MNGDFELLLMIVLCATYYALIIAPYQKIAKQQRDAPISHRILVIARKLAFLVLYSAAFLMALARYAAPWFGPGSTIVLIAGAVAALETLWGPPGEAEWASATRIGLVVCKFTLLGTALALVLYGVYVSRIAGVGGP